MSPEAIEMWIGCRLFRFHLPIYFSNETTEIFLFVDEEDENFMFSTSAWIHNFIGKLVPEMSCELFLSLFCFMKLDFTNGFSREIGRLEWVVKKWKWCFGCGWFINYSFQEFYKIIEKLTKVMNTKVCKKLYVTSNMF